MRIATYNVEWFASLFDEDNKLLIDKEWSGRYDVTREQQINALGHVFKTLDADAIMVIEAPNSGKTQDSKTALENFARHFELRQNRAVLGFENDTQQEIALLYDPDILDAYHDPKGRETGPEGARVDARFDGVFRLDVNVDNEPDKIVFSKPPLELVVQPHASQTALRLVGVHAKSKAPHGARNDREAMKISIDNRRKQLAQCIWLRQRVRDHLDAQDHLIVLGDFNDGPGLDEYEELFGQSGVEIVLGTGKEPERQLFDPHAQMALDKHRRVQPSTARFFDRRTKRYLNSLLDFVMISPNLRDQARGWTIWHPFDHPQCFADDAICKSLLLASDHFPVSLDLDLE